MLLNVNVVTKTHLNTKRNVRDKQNMMPYIRGDLGFTRTWHNISNIRFKLTINDFLWMWMNDRCLFGYPFDVQEAIGHVGLSSAEVCLHTGLLLNITV